MTKTTNNGKTYELTEATEHGSIIHDGKTYAFTQDAYLARQDDHGVYWSATAESEDGDIVTVEWLQHEDFDGDDGSNACDWTEVNSIA